MGQYYKFIILGDNKKNNKECIILVIHPHSFGNGSKLMEHSYKNTNIMNSVECLIGPCGQFYKSRIVWAGDYANEEDNEDNEDNEEEPMNLYHLADYYSLYEGVHVNKNFKYIVNHTKKQYVDMNDSSEEIHPLPLLISEGNGQGGGDFRGEGQELCGTWSRDVISMEHSIPEGYTKLECHFSE